jgi:transposase
MPEGTTVGLDVHARSVTAAVIDEATGELRVRRMGPGAGEVARWLAELAAPVRAAYEAGPTGYALARACHEAGVACLVAAPSRIPRAGGDRVKTDRKDAERIARALRLGDLVGVRIPDREEEAARDLVRAREAARADLMRARHRVSKLLLRHDRLYAGRAWTGVHDAWLRRQRFASPALQLAFDQHYLAVLQAADRRGVLDRALIELAGEARWAPVVGRLSCLRGVSALTAVSLAVEIGEWRRFRGGSIGSYLGLVPSEHSSGEQRSQGSITKTGNGHVRRLLVEAAWHQRRPYRPSADLLRRRRAQRPEVIARADQAARRLHWRWQALALKRGKRPSIVAVAVARELAGWCWSLAVMDD